MDYNKKNIYLRFQIVFCFTVIFLISCSENKKSNIENTYYIDLVNFNKDSLRKSICENMFGKVSFFKKNELVIFSLNYLTDEYPKMHYFRDINELGKVVKTGTKKIRVEFFGDYTVDSINYSLEKYVYKNREWIKISNMGVIKAINTYKKAKEFAIKEYAKQITNNIAAYTYD